MESNPYFVTFNKASNPKGRLLCFHHAGGSSQLYSEWPEHFDVPLDIEAVELPGRGRRFGEDPAESLHEPAEQIVEAVADNWMDDDVPTVFFGHSIGAALAFEVAWRLEELGHPIARLLVSGTSPAHRDDDKVRHKTSDDEFLEFIEDMGGIPNKIRDNPQFLEAFLPVVRADIKMIETYEVQDREPFDAPMTALGGRDHDILSQSDLEAWEDYTADTLTIHQFDGGHFYLAERPDEVVGWLEEHLIKTGALSK